MKSLVTIIFFAVAGGLMAMSPLAVPWEHALYDKRMTWWVKSHPRSKEIVLIGLDQPPRDSVCGSYSIPEHPTSTQKPLVATFQALERFSPKAVVVAFQLPDCESLRDLGKTLAPLKTRGIPLVLVSPKPTTHESNISQILLLQSLRIEKDPDWYRVQFGDTLSTIAKRFGTSVAALKTVNELPDDTIRIGQRLRLSKRGARTSPSSFDTHVTAVGSLELNTPSTSDGVLRTVTWTESSLPPLGSVLADLLFSKTNLPKTPVLNSVTSTQRRWNVVYTESWNSTPRPFQFHTLSQFLALDEHEKKSLVTDKAVILFDAMQEFRVPTPRGESVPLAYVHAQLLLNRLTGTTIPDVPRWWTLCLIVLGGVAMVSVSRFQHYKRWSDTHPAVIWAYPLGWVVLLGSLYGVGQYGAFLWGYYLMPVMPPLATLIIGGIGVAVCTWQQSFSHLTSKLEDLQSERDAMLDERARLLETAEENTEEILEMNRQLQEKEAAIQLLKVEQERQKDIQRQFLPHAITLRPLQEGDLAVIQQKAADMGIVTRDKGMLEAFHKLQQLAEIPKASVCIFGETGTGKELYAKAFHRLSERAAGPFETINMGELTGEKLLARLFGQEKGGFTGIENRQGLFRLADKGTLFLDEIANLDLEGQRQLLRVLEDGRFTPLGGKSSMATDVRLVFATNKNLKKEWAEGRFMEDLYHRLTRGGIIRLVPLKDRSPDDLQLLVESLVRKHCETIGRVPVPLLTEEALEWILAQPWPGNVRELDGVVFRSLMANGNMATIQKEHVVQAIDPDDIQLVQDSSTRSPAKVWPSPPLEMSSLSLSDEEFMELFSRYQGAIGGIAEYLGLHRDRVRLRVKGLALEAICQGEGPNHAMSCDRMLRGHPLSRSARRKLEKKIQGYWETLVKTCQDWDSPEEAVQAIWQQNENMPSRKHYLRDLDAFIRRQYSSLRKL